MPSEFSKTPGPGGKTTGISGAIVSASDVSGIPDTPLPNQLILAVPHGKASEILGAGVDRLGDNKLRFLKARLPEANPAIQWTLSDPAGRYTLSLEPGEYILCVGESETTPPGFPATTRGCGRIRVLSGELGRIDISSGFGEILLKPR